MPWHAGEKRETRLVVIGRKGLDRAAIVSALKALGD
jgi:cobalamin synthesis protein cobW-like protein